MAKEHERSAMGKFMKACGVLAFGMELDKHCMRMALCKLLSYRCIPVCVPFLFDLISAVAATLTTFGVEEVTLCTYAGILVITKTAKRMDMVAARIQMVLITTDFTATASRVASALALGQTAMSSRACTLTIECMVPAGFSGLRATFILANLQVTGGMVMELWFLPTEDDRKGTGTRAIS
jgi:hypothetical protein